MIFAIDEIGWRDEQQNQLPKKIFNYDQKSLSVSYKRLKNQKWQQQLPDKNIGTQLEKYRIFFINIHLGSHWDLSSSRVFHKTTREKDR